MNRHIVYPGQIPLETDLLNVAKDAYLGLARLAEALIGTAPVLAGFAVTPTSPASMSVQIGPGQIYCQQVLDPTDFSSLGEDSTVVVKQGLQLTATTTASGTLVPPSGAGQSVNYLVQVLAMVVSVLFVVPSRPASASSSQRALAWPAAVAP